MQKFIKQNLALILAFLLPLLLILIVTINAYSPFSILKSEYNFVYATCDASNYDYPYGCKSFAKSIYSIKNNKLIVKEIDPSQDLDKDGTPEAEENYNVRLFEYDTKQNTSREILPEQAKALQLDPLLTSPDGITISNSYENRPNFFLFDGGSSYGYYLVKGNLKKKLKLINDDRYYSRENFHFIGWVLK